MLLNNLIDSFDDPQYDCYSLQKVRLKEGITIQYSFLKIDPFIGIKKNQTNLMISNNNTDDGILSFLINTELFSIANQSLKSRKIKPSVFLFEDEYYDIQLSSGDYETKIKTVQLNKLIGQSIFSEDELIINLVKHKKINIFIRLKKESNSRKNFEDRLFLGEDSQDAYPELLLSSFFNTFATFGDNDIDLMVETLGIEKLKGMDKKHMHSELKKLSIHDIHVKKDLLYLSIILNGLNKLDFNLNESNKKYNTIKKKYKDFEYKLKARYIKVRDKND